MNGTAALLLLRLAVVFLICEYWIPGGSKVKNQTVLARVSGGVFKAGIWYLFAWHWRWGWLPVSVFLIHFFSTGSLSGRGKGRRLSQIAGKVLLGISALLSWGILEGIPKTFFGNLLSSMWGRPVIWLIVLAYLTVIFPAGQLIGWWTQPLRRKLASADEEKGLDRAGLWIGRLERTLVLTFLLIQQFEAIGFLIASKSILRFGEVNRGDSRKESEYILIGTMLSLIVAIVVGLILLNLKRHLP